MVKNGVNFCKFNSNCKTHLSVLFFIRWTVTDQSRINLKKTKDWLMEFHFGYYEQNVVCCLHEWLWRQQWSKVSLYDTEPALGSFPSDNLSSRFTSCYGSPQKEEEKKKKRTWRNQDVSAVETFPLKCKVWLRYRRKRGNVEEARRGVYQKFDRNNFSESNIRY